MRFKITGKNIEVTEGLKKAIEDKIGKLDKYFSTEITANVTLSVERDRQKIEVTIPVKGSIIRAEEVSSDMYVSIDLVEEIIERQLRRYKTRIVNLGAKVSIFFYIHLIIYGKLCFIILRFVGMKLKTGVVTACW